MLVALDHCEDADEKRKEDIMELNKDFISKKDNTGSFKKFKKNPLKIALNGRMSLIEN